jgi:hypothetical protein
MFAVSTVRPSSFAPFMVITALQVDSSLQQLRPNSLPVSGYGRYKRSKKGSPGTHVSPVRCIVRKLALSWLSIGDPQHQFKYCTTHSVLRRMVQSYWDTGF